MTDPVIHAKMAMLIQDEKKFTEELDSLRNEEIPLWSSRVELAREKGMDDLARQASERFDALRLKANELAERLEIIETQKKNLRFEARRPSGDEVRRAEALVESVKLAGLVDPDESLLERELAALGEESEVELDFDNQDI